MATEVSVFYTDTVLPYLDGDALVGFLWAVQDGRVVAGSQTVAQATAPVFNADYGTIVYNFILANIKALNGNVAPAGDYAYPNALNANNEWGLEKIVFGNSFHTRPFVALAYTADYIFGPANIPNNNDLQHPRTWYFRFESAVGDASSQSPGLTAIDTYNTDKGFPPYLIMLELNPE